MFDFKAVSNSKEKISLLELNEEGLPDV